MNFGGGRRKVSPAPIPQQLCSANDGGGRLPSTRTSSLSSARRTIESYERELIQQRSLEIRRGDEGERFTVLFA